MAIEVCPPTDTTAAIRCPKCGWHGTIADAKPKVDSRVQCPACSSFVEPDNSITSGEIFSMMNEVAKQYQPVLRIVR